MSRLCAYVPAPIRAVKQKFSSLLPAKAFRNSLPFVSSPRPLLAVEASCHNGDEMMQTIEAAEALLNNSPDPLLDEKRTNESDGKKPEESLLLGKSKNGQNYLRL